MINGLFVSAAVALSPSCGDSAVVVSQGEESPQAEVLALPQTGLQLNELIDLLSSTLDVAIEYNSDSFRSAPQVIIRLPDAVTSHQAWTLLEARLSRVGLVLYEDAVSHVLRIGTSEEALSRGAISDTLALGPASPTFQRINLDLKGEPSIYLASFSELFDGQLDAIAAQADGERRVIISGETWKLERHWSEVILLANKPTVTLEAGFRNISALDALAALDTRRKHVELAGLNRDSVTVSQISSHRVVLTGYTDQVELITVFFEEIDSPSSFEGRTYTPPIGWSLAECVLLARETIGLSPATSEPRRNTLDDSVQPSVQARAGLVFVNANSTDHHAIAKLFEQLTEAGPDRLPSLIHIPVKHRGAQELLPTLQSVLGTLGVNTSLLVTGEDSGASEIPSEVRNSSARLLATTQPQSILLSVSIDEPSNSLVVVGRAEILDRVREIVSTLDQPRLQVRLEVTVVSVNDSFARSLGVELTRLTDVGDTLISLGSLFGLGSVDAGLDALPAASGSGFTGVALNPGEFSVLVRAVENVSDGTSINRTDVVVTNGTAATVNSTVQEPFLQTNASDTVATTSFGGSSDAGLQITATPRITAGGRLNIDYSVSLSAFTGASADPSLPPPRQVSSVTSSAEVPDGFAIAIGTIRVDTQADSEARVPVLGSIPLIGELFKSRTNSDSSTRFYVFLRPEIVREPFTESLVRSTMRFADDPAVPGQDLGLEPEFVW